MGRTLVDPLNNRKDMLVLVLGSLGFTTDYICLKTGYTTCQVIYRLCKAGVRRADYRSGESQLARVVVRQASEKAEASLSNSLYRNGKPKS